MVTGQAQLVLNETQNLLLEIRETGNTGLVTLCLYLPLFIMDFLIHSFFFLRVDLRVGEYVLGSKGHQISLSASILKTVLVARLSSKLSLQRSVDSQDKL